MKRIASFTLLNFIKGTRERLFLGIVFLFIFLLGLSLFLSILSVGENARVLLSAGLSVIEVSGLLLLIFSLTFGFYEDKNERMLELYLSYFPRYAYTASKFLAYILLAISYLLIAGFLFTLVLLLNYTFTWQVFAGIYGVFLKLAIVIGVNLLFCCLVDSAAIALLGTIFIYVASQIAIQALRITTLSESASIKILFRFLYYLLPNTDKLDMKYQVMYAQLPSVGFFISISTYTLLYCLLLWVLSTLVFSKK